MASPRIQELYRRPKTMSSAFFCTETCGTAGTRGGSIADGLVFKDEVNFDF
jgi:hypothetical protein